MKATGHAHPVGDGAGAHRWVDALGESAGSLKLLDCAAFTPQGRALLVSLGVVEEDPLRVEAERWLKTHRGPATEATIAVKVALGPPTPPEWIDAAQRMRLTPWKEAHARMRAKAAGS